MAQTQFPKVLRVEAKFTTGKTIGVPKREREALISKSQEAVGVIAALFWCGTREVDGRWFIVDAKESFRSALSEGGSLSIADLQRIEKGQIWLASVRDHVEKAWPPFLRGFLDNALAGHDALCAEFKVLHSNGKLRERVTDEPVTQLEHRNAVRAIIDFHGPSVSGHIFQDLLAYLLVLAGYNRVQINPIGVPDIEVSEFQEDMGQKCVTLTFTQRQADRLMMLCQTAGDEDLITALSNDTIKK